MGLPTLYTCARSHGLRATWAAEEAGVVALEKKDHRLSQLLVV
jgi:hypothetical protein